MTLLTDSLGSEPRGLRDRIPRPRPSVRLRLTALYGTLFVVAGAGLVAVTNLLVRAFAPSEARVNVPVINALLNGARPPRNVSSFTHVATRVPAARQTFSAKAQVPSPAALQYLRAHPPTNVRALKGDAIHIVVSGALFQHGSDQNALLWWSIVAFGVMAIISVALAWWLAGRALSPLRQITATANTISATNLHERLDIGGPNDELTRLADTFNGLLGRLEVAFDAQRRFVANASHELRSPLARQRAVAEVALSDPDATVESLRSSYERVIAAGEEEERLIAALLLLARSDRGIEHKSPVDLDEIVRRTVASLNGELRRREIRVETSLDASLIMGDQELLERLVVNLLDNALVHNIDHGFVKIGTSSNEHGTRLVIENSGRSVDPDDLERLLQPFERAEGARTNHNGRLGLGLSIVDAIARAHNASVHLVAREEGGIVVTVEFLRASSSPEPEAPVTSD
ncbi:MAG: ATP-binding protein [Acidimicrobiales bacterium]